MMIDAGYEVRDTIHMDYNEGGEIVNEWTEHPIVNAAIEGSVSMIKVLVKHSVPQDRLGAVRESVGWGHVDCLEVLLDYDWTSHSDIDDLGALLMWNSRVNSEGDAECRRVLEFLMDRYDVQQYGDRFFQFVCNAGFIDIVKGLLDEGVDVNHADGGGLSAAIGNTELLNLLLDAGADVAANNHWAIKTAVNSNQVESAKVLIEHGSEIDLKVSVGNRAGRGTLVTDSIRNRNGEEMTKLLLDAGAKVTPSSLHSAAMESIRLVDLMMEYGASVEDFRAVMPEVAKLTADSAASAMRHLFGMGMEMDDELFYAALWNYFYMHPEPLEAAWEELCKDHPEWLEDHPLDENPYWEWREEKLPPSP